MNFALVYLGEKVPEYVFRNLAYLKAKFPEESIYFVSDSESALDKADGVGVKTFRSGTSPTLNQILDQNLTHPKSFRGNFWLHTTSRFFALMELSNHIHEPLIQIEADVFLLPTFPASSFLPITKLAFPLESKVTGAASIFYIPNPESIAHFVTFILESTAQNGSETDMTLLGKYWILNPERVEILPSLPEGLASATENSAIRAASANLRAFKGLFDPLSYGMYLLGADPSNNYARTIFGEKPEAHLISSLPLKFEQRKNSLFLVFEEAAYEIFCLHVHSKNIRIFDLQRFNHEIAKGIICAEKSTKKISFRIFFRLLRKWLVTRLRGRDNV